MHTSKRDRGFTAVEIVVVVAIALLLGALAVPVLISTVRGIETRYAATDFAGLLQKARMESARKNSFFPVQPCTYSATPTDTFYYVDLGKSGSSDCSTIGSDPTIEVGELTVSLGSGGGSAPGYSTLESALNFSSGFYSASQPATFNARGLPCPYSPSATTCVENPGTGFIYYFSGPGSTWAAVAVTPSGRVQVWGYSSGQWVQQ